ncbi:MAG: hypothetical protein GC180_03930 [Bacteroidetes bacterium]|nr:hypothetical protein [Bacteroidota bacterium]
MSIKRNIAAAFVALILCTVKLFAYRDIPTMIYLNSEEQADTIGYNLVKGMCELLYPKILDGSVPLYVSPAKELKIDRASLLALENSSGTRFDACPELFIYEYWSSNRKSTSFRIHGFSFVNKNQLGQKVAYGFIDLNDIDSLLRRVNITTTANGSFEVSFQNVLMSRHYTYHLVHMGEENFQSNPALSVKLKREAFQSGKAIPDLMPIPARKQFAYQVLKKKYTTDIDWSNQLLEAIETVLKENPELFLNYGGTRYDSFPSKAFFIPEVKGLLVEEIWVKSNHQVRLESAKIKITFAQGDMLWMELNELEKYNLVLHFQSLRDILVNKPFAYDLFQVNDQAVDPEKGSLYFDALRKAPWNQINAYVNQEI